jgi:hypothetical protein
MVEISGGCLCGKVRYSANAEPLFTGVCHCHDCQKFSGTAFAAVLAVPKAAVSVTGALKTFTKNGDSGQPIHRRFCPECGSGIMDEAALMPDAVMLNIGTLDDPSWVKPGMQIYCDSAQPWVQLGGEMKSFARMPGRPG